MTHIDTSKIERFFAFGCSFTEYAWHTWADILAYQLAVPYYNRGKSAASNPYIAAQVAQMNLSEHFGPGDLVAIMWTDLTRQDLLDLDQGWQVTGNIHSTNLDESPYVIPFTKFPTEHFLMRDLTLIKHTHDAVKATGAQWLFMSMNNIRLNASDIHLESDRSQTYDQITDLFRPVFNEIKPDCFQVIWNNDQEKMCKGAHPLFRDLHPTPIQHAQYINHWIPLNVPAWDYARRQNDQLMSFLDLYGKRNLTDQGPVCDHMQPYLGRQQTTSRKIWG